ncbi:S-adenosylmethionine decarboxylase [Candidatus Gracilibacteria bacterium]|nr:S-adenosylmethionine decarboxylase [Candidatus Gracilibacteria bacterium]
MLINPGTHILLDGRGVTIDFSSLNIHKIECDLSQLITNSGITIIDSIFHDFIDPKGAFTGIFLLGESHFSIHTFPEDNYISIDLYTCNMTHDFSKEAHDIIEEIITYFQIQSPSIRTITR